MGAGLDLSGRRRDGTTFPAEIALSALDTDQGILISAAIRDVTQQRQARDDLRRTNQNLTSFSYSLAHDLRTPLRSLAGFSTALMEDYADTLGENGRGYAQRIEAASEHMGHILDDLLQRASLPSIVARAIGRKRTSAARTVLLPAGLSVLRRPWPIASIHAPRL